jgi:hypothetical protein
VACGNARLGPGIAAALGLLTLEFPAAAEVQSHTVFAPKGQRTAVWSTTCESALCSKGICFLITNKNSMPGTAYIVVEVSWRNRINTEGIGKFCSDTKWMTYSMTMKVYVEPVMEDLYINYEEAVRQ